MSRSIVVVGAGLAGLRAVEQLRGAGWSDPVTVLGTELHHPYNRPPLTKAALKGGVDPAALAFRRRPTTEDVDWRLGTTVAGVDLDGRTVTLTDGSTLAFDGLVAASGVSSRRLDLAAPLHWRHAIRTAEDAHALHQQLRPGARVVIVGAGFIGCEGAATAVGLGRPGLAGPGGRAVPGAAGAPGRPGRRQRGPPPARGARRRLPPGPGRGRGRG